MTESEALEIINSPYIKRDHQDLVDALAVAKISIEKQIPKKPVNYDKHYYKCPAYNNDLGIDNDGLYIYGETPPNHCKYCGQKLDWNNDTSGAEVSDFDNFDVRR